MKLHTELPVTQCVDFSTWYLFAGQFRFLILQNLFLKHYEYDHADYNLFLKNYDYDHADYVECIQIYGMKSLFMNLTMPSLWVFFQFVFHIVCLFLAAANKAALAVAVAADLQFIRAEGFVFSHVADEGWLRHKFITVHKECILRSSF
jgi:hypothetical protein